MSQPTDPIPIGTPGKLIDHGLVGFLRCPTYEPNLGLAVIRSPERLGSPRCLLDPPPLACRSSGPSWAWLLSGSSPDAAPHRRGPQPQPLGRHHRRVESDRTYHQPR